MYEKKKSNERSKKALNNIIFGFIFRAVSMLGPFIVRVVVTWTIGKEFLGISGVFASILSMLSLTELGFASAIAYKCYALYATNDIERVCQYLSYFRKIYQLVGSIIVIFGFSLTPFLQLIISDALPSGLNLYVIYFVYLFQTAVSYFMSAYKTVIFTVSQRQDIESKIALACHSFLYLFQIGTLIVFRNYYFYLIALPISTILINVSRIIVARKLFPDYVPVGDITKEEKKELYKSIIPLIGHRIHGTIVISADNIIISMFLGVLAVAEYNNYFTIITALSGFIIAIYAAIQPGIGNSMATESMEKNRSDFGKISFSLIWIVGWMSICLICLLQDFIGLTFGKDSVLDFNMVLLLVLQFFIWRTFDILMTYRDVVGKWNGDTLIPYISGLFNLVSNVLLVRWIGINGVVISTILTFIVFSIPNSIRVLFKEVFKAPISLFLREYIFNTMCVAVVGLITYGICSLIPFENVYMNLMVKGLLCLFIPNVLFFLFWKNKDEYKYFKQKVLIPVVSKVKRR